jgi:hypothetical protein
VGLLRGLGQRQGGGVTRKRWSELDPRTRRLLLAAALFEGTLKIAALIDLARRRASQTRGSTLRWAVSIGLINSVGIVPISYFACGRRRPART